tara:strand:- start:26724 stop:27143 length:420 start_codon:yes stop_codon:yes gene_type:complete
MFLLDTNVLSELRKVRSGKADAKVTRWSQEVAGSSLYLSVIVIQEIEIGIRQLSRRDTAQALLLRQWFDHHVLPAFNNKILPIDVSVARRSAALHVPDPRPYRDGLIAATALVHGMTLVTRNTADFEGTGAHLLNPWAA